MKLITNPSEFFEELKQRDVKMKKPILLDNNISNRVEFKEMKTLEEIKRILAEHKEELKRLFGVKEIGIFGSYVRDEQTEFSDVDILVDFEREIGWEIVDLKDYLERLLGVKVDLVSKRGIVRRPLLWDYVKKEVVYV